MKIKFCNFPTFEEWHKNNCKFESKLGEYNIRIDIFSWNMEGGKTYAFGVAANQNPLNIYSTTVYYSSFSQEVEDKEGLQNWYEGQIKHFKEFWENYIYNTYFERVVKCNNCNCPYGYWGHGDCLAPSNVRAECNDSNNNGVLN